MVTFNDADLRPSRGGQKKYFLYFTAYRDRSAGGVYPAAIMRQAAPE